MLKKIVIALTSIVFPASAQLGNPSIATGQYDSDRSAANSDEILLNSADLNVAQFGKLFSWAVDGWIFAQPLYVPGVAINGATKNVVYVATMNNSIYAFDANNANAAPLWHTHLGTAVTAPAANGCPDGHSTGPLLGVLGTPVIDRTTNTLYAISATPTGVSSSAPNGVGYLHYIHAIDIASGHEKAGSPAQIQASVTGNGYDAQNGKVSLSPESKVFQRTSLLLANGSIYAGFGSCGSDADPWHGWVVGYNYNGSRFNQTAVFNSTPNAGQGGIWQSGRGLATDAMGDLYFNTGNATAYNANDTNFPVTSGNSTTDAQKNDYPMRFIKLNATGQFLSSYPPAHYASLNTEDLDFSSSGPLVIPGTNLLVTGGKDGIIYLFSSSDLSTPLQSFQATGTSPCSLDFDGCNQIHDLAFWNNTLYVWGGFDVLRAYTFSPSTNRFNTSPASHNTITTGKAPASFAISAFGTVSGTGILWAVLPDSSVHAFNADNVGSELWNSNQNSGRDALPSYPKFTEPTVANGRVYVATHSNQVVVYGLLADFSLSTSATSVTADQNGTASLTVNVTALKALGLPITLSVSGLPAGASAAFTPSSLSGSESSTLKISTTNSTPTGTYDLLITGLEGNLKRTANLSLKVTTPDRTPPHWTCCTYTADPDGSYTLGYSAFDFTDGLKSIEAVQVVNAQISIPAFRPGTTNVVHFTATETGTSSYAAFELTDVAGNVAYINAIGVDAARAKGQPLGYPVKNLGRSVGWLTVENGNPGLENVRLQISNGPNVVDVQIAGLKNGEVRVLNLTSDFQAGSAATITPLGTPGGTAMFVFASAPATGSSQ